MKLSTRLQKSLDKIPTDLQQKLLADMKADVAFARRPVCPRCGKVPAQYGDLVRCVCGWQRSGPLPVLDDAPRRKKGGNPKGRKPSKKVWKEIVAIAGTSNTRVVAELMGLNPGVVQRIKDRHPMSEETDFVQTFFRTNRRKPNVAERPTLVTAS